MVWYLVYLHLSVFCCSFFFLSPATILAAGDNNTYGIGGFNRKATESWRVVLKYGTTFQSCCLKAGTSFQKDRHCATRRTGQLSILAQQHRHRFSIESGHRLTKLEVMPRGGRRKGSGRKRLDKTPVKVRLDPDLLSLLSLIAMFEKTSIGAAIEKIAFDPVEVLSGAPPTENHYSVTLRGSRAIVHILKTAALRTILQNLKADDHGGEAQSLKP
jgi:hypothetical protein